MDALERVKKVMSQLGLNSKQFALEIGIQGSTLSHLLNGRNNPSMNVLKKVLSRYPNINSDWLIMGIGPMNRGEKDSQTPNLFGFQDEISSFPISSPPISTPKYESSVAPNQHEPSIHHPTAPSVVPEVAPVVTSPTVTPTAIEQAPKTVRKIIVYYTDNTFQEFVS